MTLSPNILLPLISYGLGSIPFALLVSKANGKDIRTLGSGNVGATNVYRCIGRWWGILTFFLDFFKGLAPVMLLPLLFQNNGTDISLQTQAITGAAAIAGHMFPIFLKFKGGKGVATGAGVALGLAPPLIGIAFVVWAVTMALTRTVSLASILAAVTLPIAAFLTGADPLLKIVFTALGLLIVWRHRSNIQRLLNGEEFGFKKK